MRFRLPAALAIVVLAALAFAAPASAGDGFYSKTGESRLGSLINAEHRRVCGNNIAVRQPYQNRNLARWRAKDMLERRYFSHTIKGTNNKAFDYFRRYGIRTWQAGGEIIAYHAYYGENEYDSASRAFRQFMGSSTHRSVIRTCRYNAVGVGNYVRDGRFYYAVIFTDQPTQRTEVRTTIRRSPSGTIREYVSAGWRLYIWSYGYGYDGRRWEFGIFPGRTGWGYVPGWKTS